MIGRALSAKPFVLGSSVIYYSLIQSLGKNHSLCFQGKNMVLGTGIELAQERDDNTETHTRVSQTQSLGSELLKSA